MYEEKRKFEQLLGMESVGFLFRLAILPSPGFLAQTLPSRLLTASVVSRYGRAFSTKRAKSRQTSSKLGGGDRRKLDEYLTSVREIEMQVQRAEKQEVVIEPGIEKPFGVPPEFAAYFTLMTDRCLHLLRCP